MPRTHDYRDIGGRATHGAITEDAQERSWPASPQSPGMEPRVNQSNGYTFERAKEKLYEHENDLINLQIKPRTERGL